MRVSERDTEGMAFEGSKHQASGPSKKQANQIYGTYHVNSHVMAPLDIVLLLIRITQQPFYGHSDATEPVCQHAGRLVIPLLSLAAMADASAPFPFHFILHSAVLP